MAKINASTAMRIKQEMVCKVYKHNVWHTGCAQWILANICEGETSKWVVMTQGRCD